MDKFHKAKGLTEDNKVKYKGLVGSSLYFSVLSNSDHQVLFRIANNRWMCDCEWAALHKKDCSHILAAKQWLKTNESSLRAGESRGHAEESESIKTDKTQ